MTFSLMEQQKNKKNKRKDWPENIELKVTSYISLSWTTGH